MGTVSEKVVWSGTTTSNKHGMEGGPHALRKQTVLDVQWSDCPVEVEEVIRHLWKAYELDNDRCILKISLDDIRHMQEGGFETEQWFQTVDENNRFVSEHSGWYVVPVNLDPLIQYLEEQGVDAEEEIWIHWWW